MPAEYRGSLSASSASDPSGRMMKPRVKDRPTWIWWYQYVHTMLGWTIVPFIVATLTGIIK